MPGPKPTAVELTIEVQQGLRMLAMGHKTRQQIAKRARMILLAEEGKDNSAIGLEVGVSRLTVKRWRERWLILEALPLKELSVEERLEDLPRPGDHGGPTVPTGDNGLRIAREIGSADKPVDGSGNRR